MLQYACTEGSGCATSSCFTSKPPAMHQNGTQCCRGLKTLSCCLSSTAQQCGHTSAGVPASGSAQAGSAQAGSAGGSAQAQDGGSPWNLLAAMLTLPESYTSGGSEVASLLEPGLTLLESTPQAGLRWHHLSFRLRHASRPAWGQPRSLSN